MTKVASSLSILSRGVVSVAMLVMAVAVVGNGLDRQAESDPSYGGVVPDRFSVYAQFPRAESRAVEKRFDQVIVEAKKLVARAPIKPSSTALLGSAYLLAGDAKNAEQAFTVAAQFGWRSKETQIYWMQRAMELGDFEVAAMRLDALLRLDHSIQRNYLLLRPAEQFAPMRQAFLRRMTAGPAWLADYISDVADFKGDQFSSRVAMLSQTPSVGVVAGCRAISRVINQMTSKGALSEAYSLWRAHCPQARTYMTDPAFEFLGVDENETTMFGWQIQTSGSLSYDRATGDKSLLSVTNVGPTIGGFIKQFVMAPPGDYRIRWYSSEGKERGMPAMVPHFGCEELAIPAVEGIVQTGSGWWAAPLKINAYCTGHWLQFFVARDTANAAFGRVSIQPAMP